MFLGSRLVFADLPRHDPGLTRTGQSAFPDQIFLKICTGGFRTGAAKTFVNTCRLQGTNLFLCILSGQGRPVARLPVRIQQGGRKPQSQRELMTHSA